VKLFLREPLVQPYFTAPNDFHSIDITVRVGHYFEIKIIGKRFKARVHSDRGLAQNVERVLQIEMRQGLT
jgi:hypothetical protein